MISSKPDFPFLLIACGVFAFTSAVTQYQRYPNSLHENSIEFASRGQAPQQASLTTRQVTSASCPEKNGRFAVGNQCDAYVECIDGVGEQKLCPEGLVFNPDARFNYPCGYPIDVNCEGRPNLQPAQPSEDCPHQYGYFKVGDHQHCGQFMNCADGRGYVFDCPEGLAFNPASYRCDWPDQVPDCDAEAFLGFRCPDEKEGGFFGGGVRFYRSTADCQHYFICVNGKPRLMNCGEGNAFSELIDACDAAENVTGCEPLEQGPISTKGHPTRLF